MEYKTVERGKIIYYLTDTSIVVKVGISQHISYNVYNSPSRSSLIDFKKKIMKSKQNQYATVVDQMDLAQKCKLIGTGIRKPEWIKE